MELKLSKSKKPITISIDENETIRINGEMAKIEDLLRKINTVLTNGELLKRDPRLVFVYYCKDLRFLESTRVIGVCIFQTDHVIEFAKVRLEFKPIKVRHTEFSLEDFLEAVFFLLINKKMKFDDPRITFVKYIQQMRKVSIPGKSGLIFFSEIPLDIPEI